MIKNPASLFASSLFTAFLTVQTHAAVAVYAEYRLGESGSLAGTNQLPRDSSGGNRHVTESINGNTVGILTSAITAPGSTRCIDTRATSPNQGWYAPNNISTLATDNFAVGVYASAPALGNADVISLGGINNAFKLSLGTNGWAASSHNIAWIGNPGGIPGSFKANQWVHLALVRRSGVTTFYIDGVAQSGTYSGSPSHNTLHLAVNPGGSLYFNGRVDEARIVTFDPADTVEDIFAVLGAPPLPIRQLIQDGENSYPSVALAAGLTSEVRPGVGAGRDFTTIVDGDGFTVDGPHTLKVITNPTLEIGVAYDLFKFTSTGSPTLDLGDFILDLPIGVEATLALDSSLAPDHFVTLTFQDLGDRIWNGTAASGGSVWDSSTSNWLDLASSPVLFASGDTPRFTDAAAVKNVIVDAAGVAPNNMTFTALGDYLLSGPGSINASGSASLEGGKVSLATALNAVGSIDLLSGSTLEFLSGGSASASVINNAGTLQLNSSAALSLSSPVSGSGTILQSGMGTSTLSSTVSAATLDVAQGALVLTGGANIGAQSIAADGTLELNHAVDVNYGSTTFTGSGILRKSGAGLALWPGSSATFALDADARIEVMEGIFTGGSSANEVWTNNLADLHVADGAIFDGVEAVITVDALTGDGTIRSGFPGFPNASIVCGVADGSGDFGGSITNYTTSGAIGRLTKRGNGTQTLSGNNTYSGDTTVEAGSLVLAPTGSLRFTIGANGVNNRIIGAGSVTLNGIIDINFSAADTTPGNSWTLVNGDTLTEAYGDDFAVSDFVESSLGVWKLTESGLEWTFTEATGVLSVATAAGYSSWATEYASGQGSELDHDFDGVPNGIEYFMGEVGSSFTILPSPVTSGGNTTVTWPRDPAAVVTDFRVEFSTTLSGTWTPVPSGEVDLSNPAQIVYTFPTPLSGRRFVRLSVTP